MGERTKRVGIKGSKIERKKVELKNNVINIPCARVVLLFNEVFIYINLNYIFS